LEIARDAIQNESERVIGSVLGSKTDDGLVITEESPAILMFTTVAPSVTQTDVRQLTKLIAGAFSDRGDEIGLRRYIKEVPVTTTFRTWVQGYELAQEFVGTMAQHHGARASDIELLVSQLGISTSDTEVADTTIRGFTIAGPQHRPTILSNRNCSWNASQAGRRFTIAHELCHLLHDRPYGRQVATASGPWSPRDVEQRANAFAAMLLMPPDSVAEIIRRLDIPLASVEGIRRIAEAHQTSTFATIEHLYNLHQIDEGDREMLRVEFEAVLTDSRERPTKRRIAPRPPRQRRN
jgi:Zn-dependent peptidase ImmA (M78 family)